MNEKRKNKILCQSLLTLFLNCESSFQKTQLVGINISVNSKSKTEISLLKRENGIRSSPSNLT